MAAGRDRLCVLGYRDLGDHYDPVLRSIMKSPEIIVVNEYKEPDSITLEVDGVTFSVGGAYAWLYRMCKFAKMLDELDEIKDPRTLREYQTAKRLKEMDAERKREAHESYIANLNARKNAKRKQQRIEMKNSVLRQENAVPLV